MKAHSVPGVGAQSRRVWSIFRIQGARFKNNGPLQVSGAPARVGHSRVSRVAPTDPRLTFSTAHRISLIHSLRTSQRAVCPRAAHLIFSLNNNTSIDMIMILERSVSLFLISYRVIFIVRTKTYDEIQTLYLSSRETRANKSWGYQSLLPAIAQSECVLMNRRHIGLSLFVLRCAFVGTSAWANTCEGDTL
ncbi:hypothetical protein CBL_00900 [Carabus blaptoides fortunei]